MLFIDTETWLGAPTAPGILAPPLVCVSYVRKHPSVDDNPPILVLRDEGLNTVEWALDHGEVVVGHHIPYDFAVMAAARPSLLPKIFEHYRKGLVRDTKIRQELIDIEAGRRQDNGATWVFRPGIPGADEGPGWKKADYSLGGLIKLYAGKDRSDVKDDPDSPRLRFGLLDGVPLDRWPRAYVDYALEDVADTRAVYYAQAEASRTLHPDDPELVVNEVEQVYAAWCFHLISCWGLRTDRDAVEKLEAEAIAAFAKLQERMFLEGVFRADRCTPTDVADGKAVFYAPDRAALIGRAKKGADKEAREAELQRNLRERVTAGAVTKEPTEGNGCPYKYVKNTDVVAGKVVAYYEREGRPVPLTDKGSTKTDRDTLEQTDDDLLLELAEAGPITTILRTFVPTLKLGTEVPIGARINPLVNSGRPSAAKPNIFNLPREGGVRECFVPPPGFVFCSVDYDCAELRSHAQVNYWLFGKSDARDFFLRDPKGDPHLELAASILNITPGEALKRKKAGDPEVKGLRQMAKAVNFGLPGGMGADKLVESARKGYSVTMSRDEALLRKQQWMSRWREMGPYFDYISRLVGPDSATIEQLRPPRPDGTRVPHRKRGGVGFCDGCNTLFQGLTADGAKHALTKVMYECYVDQSSPLYGSRVVVFLYDEIITAIPKDRAHEAAQRQAQIMREAMAEWLPDVPVTCEPALMSRWYKGAETVYEVRPDGSKHLVPWEPKSR